MQGAFLELMVDGKFLYASGACCQGQLKLGSFCSANFLDCCCVVWTGCPTFASFEFFVLNES